MHECTFLYKKRTISHYILWFHTIFDIICYPQNEYSLLKDIILLSIEERRVQSLNCVMVMNVLTSLMFLDQKENFIFYLVSCITVSHHKYTLSGEEIVLQFTLKIIYQKIISEMKCEIIYETIYEQRMMGVTLFTQQVLFFTR